MNLGAGIETPPVQLLIESGPFDTPAVGLRPRKSTSAPLAEALCMKHLRELLRGSSNYHHRRKGVTAYAKDRLQSGSRYIDNGLPEDRDITPKTGKFLSLQNGAYQVVLTRVDRDLLNQPCKILRTLVAFQIYDKIYHSEVCFSYKVTRRVLS